MRTDTDRSTSAHATEWVVLATDRTRNWAASEVEWHLQRRGLRVARVDCPAGLSPSRAVTRLEAAAFRLRHGLGARTVHFAGVGAAALAALEAAGNESASVIVWRGDVAGGRRDRPLPAAALVVVHLEEGGAARRRARSLADRLGPAGRLAVVADPDQAAAAFDSWVGAARSGSWPAPALAPATASPVVRLRRLAVPAAVAVGAGTMLAPVAAAAAPASHTAATTSTAATTRTAGPATVRRSGDGTRTRAAATLTSATRHKSFHGKNVPRSARSGDVHAASTGSRSLIDDQGLQWFVNTDISFSTSSSASGAMSEANYTHSVAASTLNDSYDGYNALCVSTVAATGACSTANGMWSVYNKNGPATTECPGTASGVDRQVDFAVQTVGTLAVSRKVFVPDNDHFARWLNVVTNNGSSAQSVELTIANNLGSDSNTVITGSSSGDLTASTADNWVTTFQNWSGTTTSDPRLGHVLEGPGAKVPLSTVSFANGNDNPYWSYNVTIQPGQTIAVLNFGVADPTQAQSKADAARLDALPANALQCLTATEKAEIVNFNATPPPPPPPPPPPVPAGRPNAGGDVTPTPDGKGYWVAKPDGRVYIYGDAPYEGSASGVGLAAPVRGMAATPDGNGYWLVGSDGGVFTYGDARFYGSAAGLHLAEPIVGIAATPDGKGYWLVGADGGVFAFGDAGYSGSASSLHLAAPVVGISPTGDGHGYWLVGADGGVFAYGDAHYHGSANSMALAAPVVGLAHSATGAGYWLVGADGGVFAYGDALYHGSSTRSGAVGIIASPDGGGYAVVDSDGTASNFGDSKA